MHQLVRFEWMKIIGKRSFILAVSALFLLNIFLLWYTNLPDEEAPDLAAYKAFQQQIVHMTEEEKGEYLTGLKERLDGVSFNIYQSGDYLELDDSFWQEKALINAIYAEWQKVSGYDAYLQSVQQAKDTLSGISIFGGQDENTFSARNIQRSAEDYASLTSGKIRWMPEKAVTQSMESTWTDLLLLLSVFLYVGNLILEEKEKKLFFVIRSAKRGIYPSILSKLLSLLIYSLAMAFLLYGSNLVFFNQAVGLGDLSARIQSMASYMESSLPISIFQYILLSIFTKGLVLFGIGTILTALSVAADNLFLPYLTGLLLYGGSLILYALLPSVGVGSIFKYSNLAGFLKTENLYGAYLNFDMFGHPVSRLTLSWILIALLIGIGTATSVLFFAYGENFELKKRLSIHFPFRPHGNRFRHEGYKILITNKALIILLLFSVLIGYRNISHSYNPSVQEQYYRELMQQLEGELTEEKEEIIQTEQTRYDEAFANIEKVDQLIQKGKLDQMAGESLKMQWYPVTAFYPSFERVLQQYERISDRGGNFLYDTGYLYLFGTRNNDFLIDLLMLSLGVILSFCNAISMEYQSGTWPELCATKTGKGKILLRKALVCVIAAAMFTSIPILCRALSISAAFPLHGLGSSIRDIPCYQDFAFPVPVIAFLAMFVFSQVLSLAAVTLAVLGLSYWRKSHIQALFFGLLIFAVPLVLTLLGFSFAQWFSVYPIYGWSGG